MMMICRFCQAPINTGALPYNKELRSWTHGFALRECLSLLTYSCINCFGEIVRLQEVVPKRPYRDEWHVRRVRTTRIKWADELTETEKEIVEINRNEPRAYLARCIARHIANLIAKTTKEKTTKRGRRTGIEEIVIHPPESHDREILMLEVCASISDFYRQENRDMSSAARSEGTAAFWKSSAHFRHLRKELGIKGRVCVGMNPKNANWRDDTAADRLRQAFYSSRHLKEILLRIETELKTAGVSCCWQPLYVWEQVYEELMCPAIIPLRFRLASYKWARERSALRRRLA